jgi:SDR family mycofactocin-dependent oxidoreductase
MGRVAGKVALITGGARGQGRSHAITLAREGADILAIDVAAGIEHIPYGLATPEDMQQTVAEVEALDRRMIAVQGDVRRQADLDDLVRRGIAEFGRIDIVVANAGVWTVDDLWKITDDQWNTVLDVNAGGVWRTIKAVAPHMIERQQGSIILIASGAAKGGRRLAHYVASKAAVVGLMAAAALELGPHGIRCNVILPGGVDTAILDWQGGYDMLAGGEGLGTRQHLVTGARVSPLLPGRGLLAPQAISNAVLWLASDESSEVTGIEIPVDAGNLIQPGLNATVLAENIHAEAAESLRKPEGPGSAPAQ